MMSQDQETIRRKDGKWTSEEIDEMLREGVPFETTKEIEEVDRESVAMYAVKLCDLKKILLTSSPPKSFFRTYGKIKNIKRFVNEYNFDLTVEEDGEELDAYYNNTTGFKDKSEHFNIKPETCENEQELFKDVIEWLCEQMDQQKNDFQTHMIEGSIISMMGKFCLDPEQKIIFKIYDYRFVENKRDYEDHRCEIECLKKNKFYYNNI